MSGLIGQTITFSITKEQTTTGLVLDKLIIREKPTDNFSVTGYLVVHSISKRIEPIAYWRIKEISDEI